MLKAILILHSSLYDVLLSAMVVLMYIYGWYKSSKDNNGKRNILSTSARELRQIIEVRNRNMFMQSASTTREAILVLKNQLKQGIAIDSNMYVEVLKQCLKQKDLVVAKQVHDCTIKSGMKQNVYSKQPIEHVYQM